MMHKHVELLNLERYIASKEFFLGMELPTGGAPGGVAPWFAADLSIGLAWLQWHAKPQFRPVSDVLAAAVERVSTSHARAIAEDRSVRGQFDWVLLISAVLSGDLALSRRVASEVHYATPGRPAGSHFQAVAGIIKARLLGESDAEQPQLDLVGARPDYPLPTPAIGLLRSFVKRDYRTLDKEVTKGGKKHWTDRFLGSRSMPVLVKDEPDHLVLDIGNKASSWLWAYPEAVFAKLAMQDGAKISYDDVWFPLGLVSAMREGAGL